MATPDINLRSLGLGSPGTQQSHNSSHRANSIAKAQTAQSQGNSSPSGSQRRSQAATSERERSLLLRTVTHLRKDEKVPVPKPFHFGDADSDHIFAQPYTHVDLAPPPEYQRSGRQRLSLDVRRSRYFASNEDVSLIDDQITGSLPKGSARSHLPLRARAANKAARLRSRSVAQMGSEPALLSSSIAASEAPICNAEASQSSLSLQIASGENGPTRDQTTYKRTPDQKICGAEDTNNVGVDRHKKTEISAAPGRSVSARHTPEPIVSALRTPSSHTPPHIEVPNYRSLRETRTTEHTTTNGADDIEFQNTQLRAASRAILASAPNTSGHGHLATSSTHSSPSVEDPSILPLQQTSKVQMPSSACPSNASLLAGSKSLRISFDLSSAEETLRRDSNIDLSRTARRPSLASIIGREEDQFSEGAGGQSTGTTPPRESCVEVNDSPERAMERRGTFSEKFGLRSRRNFSGDNLHASQTRRKVSSGHLRSLLSPRKVDASPNSVEVEGQHEEKPRKSLSMFRRASQDLKSLTTARRPSQSAMHVVTSDADSHQLIKGAPRSSMSNSKARRVLQSLNRTVRKSLSEHRSSIASQEVDDPTDPTANLSTESETVNVSEANEAFAQAFGPLHHGDMDASVQNESLDSSVQLQEANHQSISSRDAYLGGPRPSSGASNTNSFYSFLTMNDDQNVHRNESTLHCEGEPSQDSQSATQQRGWMENYSLGPPASLMSSSSGRNSSGTTHTQITVPVSPGQICTQATHDANSYVVHSDGNHVITVITNKSQNSSTGNESGATDPHVSQPSSTSRRTGFSSRLSHIPRLNSAGGDGEGSGSHRGSHRGSGSGGNGSHGGGGGDDGDQSDNDTADEADPDGMESETETDTDASLESEDHSSVMPGSLPAETSRLSHNNSSISMREARRPSGISLPPIPSFLDEVNPSPVTTSPQASEALGRSNWTTFSTQSPADTPSWFATPRAEGPLLTSKSVAPLPTQTPRSNRHADSPSLSQNDASYFSINPPSSSNAGNSRSREMPPPSPSIITRSRAPSTASVRSVRNNHFSRETQAFPPMTPLSLHPSERARSPQRSTTATGITLTERSSQMSKGAPTNLSVGGALENDSPDKVKKISNVEPRKQSSQQLRPGLYKQESRSLIDLNSSTRKHLQFESKMSPLVTEENRAFQASNAPEVPSKDELSSDLQMQGSSNALRRRQSMFEVGAAPPPYSVILKRADGSQKIYPREEEGKEKLPCYSCSVHIEGYLPRKMEFSSPGVQAKDRGWRRMYFILHGTSLQIYRTDLSQERTAGIRFKDMKEGPHVHIEPMNEDGPSGVPNFTASGNADRKHPRSSMDKTPSDKAGTQPPQFNGHSSQQSNSASHSGGLSAAVEAALSGSLSHIPFGNRQSTLIKQYTLQGAESGLAADYLKRRHVVRIRAEGEQFLIQTRNDRHVVDWIEAFQAATNVAMDLERRPMPKFITLPRRRRRRRREGTTTSATNSAQNQEASEVAEAQRRSLAGRGHHGSGSGPSSVMSGVDTTQRGTSIGLRTNPPRPLGLPGNDSPDPSAAFERMLREEEDDRHRQNGGDMV